MLKSLMFVLLPVTALSQGFVSTGNMNLARAIHTATLLNDGRVLVTGGWYTSGGITNTAEIYSPTTGTWRYTLFPMNEARTEHTATLLQNGKVLIAGGGSLCCSLKTAEIFDPATETFTLTGSMTNERHGFEAVRLNDGRVLVVSGASTVTFLATPTNEVYNSVTGSWSAAPSLAAGATFHTATLLPSGQVLIAGGFDGYTYTAYNFVYLYTPATNSLVAMSPLLMGRLDHGAALLSSGKVLIAAGADASHSPISSTEVYDPTTPNGQSVAGSSLNQNRRYFTTTLLGNGNVLAIGGCQQGCAVTGWLDTAELRDAGTGNWALAGSMSTPRGYHTATLLPNGKVLVAGGANAGLLMSAELWDAPAQVYNVRTLYDPTKAVRSGSTIPIKLQLCDAAGGNLSSPGITLHATGVSMVSSNITGPVEDSGNSNPDNDFRYDAGLGGTGGYIFNLNTNGLATGSYNLKFTVGTAPTVYTAPFQVK